MYGLHFTDTLDGRTFSQAATPLGLAIPIYTATAIAGGMPIWNPPGSNVVIELVSVDIEAASGTGVGGAIGLMVGQLSSIGTATGCSAFAATVPMNGYLMGGKSSKAVSSNAGTVTVTAGVATAPVAGVPGAGWTRSLADLSAEVVNTTTTGLAMHTYSFNGTVAVPPGVLVYLAATVATGALIASTIVWKEHYINLAVS